MLLAAMRIRDLVVFVVPFHEVLQNGTTLPKLELLATLVLVDDGRNAAVGVDVEVPLLFLFVFEELDWTYLHKVCVRVPKACICSLIDIWSGRKGGSHIVLQAQLLQRDGDLEWVGSALAVQRDTVLSAHDEETVNRLLGQDSEHVFNARL